VHANRLKRACKQTVENKTLPIKKHVNKAVKRKQPKEDACDEQLGLQETDMLDTEIPLHST
jgi:chaperone required for assembly of F1-ATPase